MVRPIVFITGMVVIAVVVYFFGITTEDQFLDSVVTTGPELTLDLWREAFRLWASFGVLIALLAAFLWFVMGQWFFSLNRWTSADKRIVWLALGVVALLGAVPGVVLTPPAQEGEHLAWIFYVLNNFIVFYLSTLLFSPASFKYTPVPATYVRWW